MGDLIAANQIEKGGSIIMVQIENEYYLDKEREGDLDLDYIMQLEKAMIDCGVGVPLSFNDVSRALGRPQRQTCTDLSTDSVS
jgi:hypothetical protein